MTINADIRTDAHSSTYAHICTELRKKRCLSSWLLCHYAAVGSIENVVAKVSGGIEKGNIVMLEILRLKQITKTGVAGRLKCRLAYEHESDRIRIRGGRKRRCVFM